MADKDGDRSNDAAGRRDRGHGRERPDGRDASEGQGCTAIGTMERSGSALKLTLGSCRFTARFDGDAIQFPATLPSTCNAFCTGRATLSALNVERISASVAEAQALRSANGTALCAD